MKKDLTGLVFGRLTVIKDSGERNNYRTPLWECNCVCGNIILVSTSALTSSTTRSCGCLQRDIAYQFGKNRIKHGRRRTKVYGIWMNMKTRCYNSHNKKYPVYGGRGIIVCDKWLRFEGFYDDMGDPPDGMTLDRIDTNGMYCKENCRWASMIIQQNNRNNNHLISFNDETLTIAQWGKKLGLGKSTIWTRLSRGWSVSEALMIPANNRTKIKRKIRDVIDAGI